MAGHVRTLKEGTLRMVQASGVGTTFATGSAPASALAGFCEGLNYSSARTIVTMSDRGVPIHHAAVEDMPIDIDFTIKWVSGTFLPNTASGTTLPLMHLEHRASARDEGAASAFYHQFFGVAIESLSWKEGKEGDTLQVKGKALGMNGPTGSGYLS